MTKNKEVGKLKVDPESGNFICSECGKPAPICNIVDDKIVCRDCMLKGKEK